MPRPAHLPAPIPEADKTVLKLPAAAPSSSQAEAPAPKRTNLLRRMAEAAAGMLAQPDPVADAKEDAESDYEAESDGEETESSGETSDSEESEAEAEASEDQPMAGAEAEAEPQPAAPKAKKPAAKKAAAKEPKKPKVKAKASKPKVKADKPSAKKSTKAPGLAGNKVKKPHRFKAGTVALREIRKMQKSTATVIPRAAFERLIREVGQSYKNDLRWSPMALEALQSALEHDLVRCFRGINTVAVMEGPTGKIGILSRHLRTYLSTCINSGCDEWWMKQVLRDHLARRANFVRDCQPAYLDDAGWVSALPVISQKAYKKKLAAQASGANGAPVATA